MLRSFNSLRAYTSFQIPDQHYIPICRAPIHDEIPAIFGQVEIRDDFALEVGNLFRKRPRYRLAPEIRDPAVILDI